MNSPPEYDLVDSNSSSLHLSHPTPNERIKTWTTTAATWGDPDLIPLCLQRFQYLTTIPLAKNGGMTMWILTDAKCLPDQRPILSSCETFRKRSLTSDAQGNTNDNMVYGIASVFTPPRYRRRGYAARLMKELANKLHSWQSAAPTPCIGSILYSDIGRRYYAKLGWHVNPTNSHYTFRPARVPWPSRTEGISKARLAELCERDEIMIRNAMKCPRKGTKRRVTIIPDIDHMLWHIGKEEYMSELFLGKIPLLKGAITGPPGNQIWAIWTHCYYSHPEERLNENGLYILRLVVQNAEPTTDDANQPMDSFNAILQAAQYEATEWKLDYITLWEPSLLVQGWIDGSGIEYAITERKEEGIASGMWYDANGSKIDPPLWINNERYAYC
ncbi:hypothetical protein BDV36DRAFT_239019 [Aspergillus pseudocaelatus]|uniref:LYC1 C-terminal domain-containing protein n=1 Tax=Aspergillus pseudocaelatus TaxID=1825620 RepID=A0ABQ6WBU4_9EURO|nr:hypothetical protein BDV36DRAFT_239019 [Aspergillus pseudocaelatus]